MTELPLAGRTIGLLSSWASRLGGGVFEAVVAQAGIIRQLGGTARIFAIADEFSAQDAARLTPSEVTVFPRIGPDVIAFAPRLAEALIAAQLDCLHLHGIWKYPSRAANLWSRHERRGHIVSVHGMLDPWITGRGKWKKHLARFGYERESWRRTALFHALTMDEAADIARETGRSEITVIPNAAPAVRLGETTRDKTIVYIGRIHPKKNVLGLVAAWRMARLPPDARLVLAGWGEPAHVGELERTLGDSETSISFIGGVFGQAKDDLLAKARFTILASHSEGLPMSVLEGWAAGTPSIQSAACHLPEGLAAKAALLCETAPERLAPVLEHALAMPDGEWLSMSGSACDLAEGPFHQATIAAQWAQAYLRVIAKADPAARHQA